MTERQQTFFGPSPHQLARTEHPETSKRAARELMPKVGSAMAKALRLLQENPGSTASELDAVAGTPAGSIRKRLNDLRERGLSFTKGSRRCHITGRQAQLWYPV